MKWRMKKKIVFRGGTVQIAKDGRGTDPSYARLIKMMYFDWNVKNLRKTCAVLISPKRWNTWWCKSNFQSGAKEMIPAPFMQSRGCLLIGMPEASKPFQKLFCKASLFNAYNHLKHSNTRKSSLILFEFFFT